MARELDGLLIQPDDGEYDRVRRVFNADYDTRRPAAVARVASAADVQRCVAFAAATGIDLTARSGGHSYVGASTVADGLVVDLRPLNQVSVGGGTATVGAGARLIEVYGRLAEQGVTVPAGTCPTVGIGGLTLGGGIGVTARARGLTCDSLVAARLVTADGSLLRTSADEHPDLLWALRGGGGGAVGIVVDFEFAPSSADDLVMFVLNWDPASAADVLPAWFQWAPSEPDELWSNCVLRSSPSLQMVGTWLGSQADLEGRLDALVALTGTQPTGRSVRTRSHLDTMRALAGCSELTEAECDVGDGPSPAGRLERNRWKSTSAYVDRPPDDAGIAAIVAAVDRGAAPAGASDISMMFDSNGGAMNRVPVDATAFPHRSTLASLQLGGSWRDAASAEPTRRWVEQARQQVAPWINGGAYANYLDLDRPDPGPAHFGPNWDRLVATKQRWDPTNLFHVGTVFGS